MLLLSLCSFQTSGEEAPNHLQGTPRGHRPGASGPGPACLGLLSPPTLPQLTGLGPGSGTRVSPAPRLPVWGQEGGRRELSVGRGHLRPCSGPGGDSADHGGSLSGGLGWMPVVALGTRGLASWLPASVQKPMALGVWRLPALFPCPVVKMRSDANSDQLHQGPATALHNVAHLRCDFDSYHFKGSTVTGYGGSHL